MVIDDIIEDAKKQGYDVRIRDVGFAILSTQLNDSKMAYMLIFGEDPNHDTFITLDRIKYLFSYFKTKKQKENSERDFNEIAKMLAAKSNRGDSPDSMTFEDNREGIELQLREIVELKKEAMNVKSGEKDLKTLALLQKTEADLRVKLNDKFGASEKAEDQYIVVQTKFNHICQWTNRECWLQTKEYAKEHWNLIEKDKQDGK